MKKIGWVCKGLLILALSGLTANANAKDWIKGESEHFTVYSNLGQSATRDYLRELESFKFLAELMLGTSPQSTASSARFTIYFLSSQEQLDIVRPQLGKKYAGVYIPCSEGATAFASMRSEFGSDDDNALITLQHEYAHHLMFSHINHFLPRWYVEGFADYLSTVTLRRDKFSVGDNTSSRTYALANGSSWIDFHLLLDTNKYLDALGKNKGDEDHFYAQSWLLTHYMLSDTNRTKAFNKYFDLIGQGADPVASFESTTNLAVNKLEDILKKYLSNMSGIRVSVPSVPDSSIAITPLPKQQTDYILESAALRTCPSNEYGKELLDKLRASHDKHSTEIEYRLAMDRGELLYGDTAIARSDLEQLASSSPDNFMAHYLLGRAYYNSAQKEKDGTALIDKAKQEFVAAYKLEKLNAANLYYLAKSLNYSDHGNSPSKSLLNAASGAAYLAPAIYDYATLAAEVNMRAGNRDQAIRSLQPFACDPHNPKHAAGVARVITALGNGKSFYEAMARYNEPSDSK